MWCPDPKRHGWVEKHLQTNKTYRLLINCQKSSLIHYFYSILHITVTKLMPHNSHYNSLVETSVSAGSAGCCVIFSSCEKHFQWVENMNIHDVSHCGRVLKTMQMNGTENIRASSSNSNFLMGYFKKVMQFQC